MSFDLTTLIDKKVICKLPGFDFRGVFVGVSDNFSVYALKDGDKTILVPAASAVIVEVPERPQTVKIATVSGAQHFDEEQPK